MAIIEAPDVISREGMHQPWQRSRFAGRDQQVDMIVHEDAGMQRAAKTRQRLQQALQIVLPIFVVQETRQPVVAPLHHMLRNAGKIEAWKSGHAP